MTDLDQLREGWDSAAREDAFFNILTWPGKDQGRWDFDEFFDRGRLEIAEVLDILSDLHVSHTRRRSLDFGCGVGRLTQALADHYRLSVGVDISESMVEQARKHAQQTGRDNCRFHLNTKPDLGLYKDETFDLVYSMITLQHMEATLQQGYVREFVRLLSHDGVAVFQLPEGPEYHHPNPWLSMFGADRATVSGWVDDAGGSVIDVSETQAPEIWHSWRYVVTR